MKLIRKIVYQQELFYIFLKLETSLSDRKTHGWIESDRYFIDRVIASSISSSIHYHHSLNQTKSTISTNLKVVKGLVRFVFYLIILSST